MAQAIKHTPTPGIKHETWWTGKTMPDADGSDVPLTVGIYLGVGYPGAERYREKGWMPLAEAPPWVRGEDVGPGTQAAVAEIDETELEPVPPAKPKPKPKPAKKKASKKRVRRKKRVAPRAGGAK